MSELSDQTFKGMAIKTNKEAEMARMIKEEMENKIEAEEKDHQ